MPFTQNQIQGDLQTRRLLLGEIWSDMISKGSICFFKSTMNQNSCLSTMKGISFFFFLLLLFCGNDIHVVTAGPAAYASCQAMAALGCGPAGYAACQAASAAGCLSTGFGWPACYAGCQAVCAGLGGATFAACYGSAQAACAATFLAPTPWGWEQTLQVVQMVMRCAGLPFCCHTWSSISSLTATRLLYLRIYIYINIFNVIAQPHWLALPYQQLEVILYPSFSILSLSFYKSSIVTHLHGYFPQLHLHYCTNFRLSISNHSIYSVKTPKNILISIYESLMFIIHMNFLLRQTTVWCVFTPAMVWLIWLGNWTI